MTSAKMKLSHILTRAQYEIEDLVRHLKNGQKFEDLAKKYSICSSAPSGGDLGLVSLHRLDPDFAEEASKLAPGQISRPVKTRFGYHLIRRDEEPV